jgi:hypothetical protein
MSKLVFVSGDFSSGTTVLFTMFRETGDFYCLYEPLHDKLLEYLVYPLRPDEDHHVNVKPYFSEFKGFREVPRLFKPEWALGRYRLESEDEAPDLERYLRYLIETAAARCENVLLKENRIGFRLGWLRARFPEAKIVHVFRDMEKQWQSIVRRGQEYLGREDIGQERVDFAGFNVARFCEDLKAVYPELDATRSATGYERFSKLWELSFAEQRRLADVSVGLHELIADFDATCLRIGDAIGYRFDAERLRPLVVSPQGRAPDRSHRGLRDRGIELLDVVGRKYAKGRIALRYFARGDRNAARAVITGNPDPHAR